MSTRPTVARHQRLPSRIGFTLLCLGLFVPMVGVDAQTAPKRALEHADYDRWNRIQGEEVSPDGRWVAYQVTPGKGDGTLHLRSTEGATTVEIPRGAGAEFTRDARFLVFRIAPMDSVVRAERADGTRPDRLPKDSLGIIALDGDPAASVVRIADVQSFALPEDAGGVLVYHLEAAPEAPGDATPAAPTPEPDSTEGEAEEDEEKEEGTPLVIRTLAGGRETRFESVDSYSLSRDGGVVAFSTSTRNGAGDGVFVVRTDSGERSSLLTGRGRYGSPVIDHGGERVAFLTDRDADQDMEAEARPWSLYEARVGDDEARTAAHPGVAGLPDGWTAGEHGSLRFSEDGRRLFFGAAPLPEAPVEDTLPEDERVRLDVWNWKDPLIQPMQLVQVNQERRRTFQAVVHLDDRRVVQLATPDLPVVNVGDDGMGAQLLAQSNLPYQQLISWDGSYNDVYLVDVRTGERTQVLEGIRGGAALSPGGRYVSWWDGTERAWFTMEAATGTIRNVTSALPHPVHNELDDSPAPPGSYGSAGWTEGDERLVVYDAHDVWLVDPSGSAAPRNATEGVGRRDNLRFRVVRTDPDERVVPLDRPVLLSAFHRGTRAGGFYRDTLEGTGEPQRLIMDDVSFSTPVKAADADRFLITRSTFQEFPDLHVVDTDFQTFRRMSEANPQQAEVRWGSAEIVSWPSADGVPLQGILYTPEGFDASREYPLMVYFYERSSDGLHGYTIPSAGGSSINRAFYVSRGYLLFVPDIPYKLGYPGESAMNAVVPGVLSLVAQGFVDRDRIGVQGHSWGGYQIAYMITRTNLFAAAEAGAPVVNMTSAYGGIRWQTGMVRQFQYEQTQSRIGGTLWDAHLRYIENSPLFTADKVETPVLMMHNDEDGAVPWYQGIEFYAALRRLDKPVWMLNYNGEGHGLGREANRRDFAIRMQQFFDHYLMDAPAPVWMEHGVPAVDKGRTLGLELVAPSTDGGNGGQRR